MRILANSIPKSGTHLLLRLLTQLDFDMADFGGFRPSLVSDGNGGPSHRTSLRRLLGAREPGKFLGIGPHLLEGGRVPAARRFIRGRGEKVTVGVEFPREISSRWLDRRLSLVPDGSIVSAHCIYTPELGGLLEEQDIRSVCILRDPRDTAVSHMHYLKKLPRHVVYHEYKAMKDDHERLMVSITGGKLGEHILQPLGERYQRFLGWERQGGAVMVKFEDLVGSKGGGSDEAQRKAVSRVVEHLGLDIDEQEISSIQQNLFGAGRTFRKGKSGGWRDEFSEDHKQAVKDVTGDLLIELGYESNSDW